jgi:hypothetical protein
VVFAERKLSAGVRGGDGIRAERLADGNQTHLGGVAAAGPGGVGDTLSDGLQVGADCVHNFKAFEGFSVTYGTLQPILSAAHGFATSRKL